MTVNGTVSFSVRNVSRGKGQMVVASAAYISGQRIFDSYYNKIHDYTSKSGVIFTEILTPEYVPERLTDRGNTLERGGACGTEQQGTACLFV